MTLVWRPGYGGAAVSDPDAMAYLRAVEDADNQALEQGVQQAVNQFVIGCKSDGIWDAIKASCILAGARTLSGALVPLVGTAPTNFNFVAEDYNRETGLVGDGSKYLDSNRLDSADPIDNFHQSVYITDPRNTSGKWVMGAGVAENNASSFAFVNSTSGAFRSRSSISTTFTTPALINLLGTSRSSSSSVSLRTGSTSQSFANASSSTLNRNIFVFRTNLNSPVNISNARLSFYSIGEALDLALLDARVTDLMTAIGAAIP